MLPSPILFYREFSNSITVMSCRSRDGACSFSHSRTRASLVKTITQFPLLPTQRRIANYKIIYLFYVLKSCFITPLEVLQFLWNTSSLSSICRSQYHAPVRFALSEQKAGNTFFLSITVMDRGAPGLKIKHFAQTHDKLNFHPTMQG